jgi:hypothetical protein
MRRFTFDTGVHVSVNSHISGGVVSPNGIVVIPFYCEDVPNNAEFMFASDYPDLDKGNNIIFREIHNSKLISKYAYFKIP